MEIINKLRDLLEAGKISETDIERAFPQLESEDERIRKALIEGVSQIRCKGDITREQMLAYLEKQKEQKPVEWSEEDEGVLIEAYNVLEEHGRFTLANKLKHLYPQPHWKPSEEQMWVLEKARDEFGSLGGYGKIITTLIDDLKKLL